MAIDLRNRNDWRTEMAKDRKDWEPKCFETVVSEKKKILYHSSLPHFFPFLCIMYVWPIKAHIKTIIQTEENTAIIKKVNKLHE